MTKEQIQERLNKLLQDQTDMRTSLVVYDGAIQDCQYWLKELDTQTQDITEEKE